MTVGDNYYRVHTKGQTLTADFILTDWSDANELTIGETRRANLHFDLLDDLVVSNSYVVESGTIEQWGNVTIQDGATLTIETDGELTANSVTVESGGTLTQQTDSTLTEYGNLFETLLEYGKWAGSFASFTSINNTEKFEEQFNTNRSSIKSLVIGFEPSQSLKDQNVRGVWGILSDDTDNRPRALSDIQFGIELRILGWYDEYADHADLETDLEINT
jgi:hypothetical protein